VHGGGTAQELLGRAFVPADHAECASVFSLSRSLISSNSSVRRLESALVCKWIWNRCRHDCACNQCRVARRLHHWVSFSATPGGRISRSIFKGASMLSRLWMCDVFQPAPHALGLGESVLGRVRRSVRAPLRDGNLARCAAFLAAKASVKNVTKLGRCGFCNVVTLLTV
jgi:hypothetical protein